MKGGNWRRGLKLLKCGVQPWYPKGIEIIACSELFVNEIEGRVGHTLNNQYLRLSANLEENLIVLVYRNSVVRQGLPDMNRALFARNSCTRRSYRATIP